MMNDAGTDLDRQIERKLNGDAKKKTPPYSTSEKASNRLIRRLELQDMPCTIEQIEGIWYCTFWIVFPHSRERLSTGSGETRALAVARAVMNARLGMGPIGSSGTSEIAARLHWSQGMSVSSAAPAACAGCGVALPSRNRESSNRLCTVCSWRASRDMLRASGNRDGAADGLPAEISIERAAAAPVRSR